MSVIQSVFHKTFLSGAYFTIALRRRQDGPITSGNPFLAEYTFPATKEDWCADPMLAEDNGRAYLFYKAVHGMQGRIEVRELREDCGVSEPAVLFQDAGHYSYPFVFRANGSWYMIPETSDRQEVTLFRADPFPDVWKAEHTLLRGPYVDTTVFPWRDSWILLSFQIDGMTERVTPKAFLLRFQSGAPALEPMEWKQYDPLRVRGAGPVFRRGGEWIRPVQCSSENRYGNAVAFHRISVEGSRYTESPSGALTPELIRCARAHFDGLHSYSVSPHFEAIDLRCQDLDLRKPFRKLKQRLTK